MKMIYKYANVADYKAIKNATYKFDVAGAMITGSNGMGKSTVVGLPLWVFANRDLDNHNNPLVAPINEPMGTHRVDICVDIDGTEYIVSRIQTTKANGSTSNEYEIDGVPKKDKEFTAWLNEFGIDKDKFLVLSNPNIFCSQKMDETRNLLMQMGEVTDAEVLDSMDGIDEVKALIDIEKGIGLAEIKAKATADKKRVTDVHGRKGEITSAKITALKQILQALGEKTGTKQAQAIVNDMLAETIDMQSKYEQDIADAERLLFQIGLINDTRINLITDKINSHFKFVNFEFWETDTKGDKKPCCKAYIDEYSLPDSANTGKIVLGKIDIINGLQKFFDLHIPILLDNAECLSKDTLAKINTESQILISVVTNDKALKIK